MSNSRPDAPHIPTSPPIGPGRDDADLPWIFPPEPADRAGALDALMPANALPPIAPAPGGMHPARIIDVWGCRYDALEDPALLRHYRSLLTPEDCRRLERLRFPAGRQEFLVTRALVRWALSRYAGVRPQDLTFTMGCHGKPRLQAPALSLSLSFNVSHAAGICVCAVAPGPLAIGVDVEAVDAHRDDLALAARFFAPTESQALKRLPEPLQHVRFVVYWTLKEAYIKARGLGLSVPLKAFTIDLQPARPIAVRLDQDLTDDGARWRFALLRMADRHVLSVCAETDGSVPSLRYALCVPFKNEVHADVDRRRHRSRT